jgi:alkylation response protein AidB-like acyl-CoA dehydrogenase
VERFSEEATAWLAAGFAGIHWPVEHGGRERRLDAMPRILGLPKLEAATA